MTASSGIAGGVSMVLLDLGVSPDYVVFIGPLLVTAISVVGNILRNMAEDSRIAKYIG
jgi:hypothetical protein